MTTGTDAGIEAWAEVGPFYDGAGAAAVLGVSMSTLRGRRSRGSVLALRTGSGRIVYPVWQFGPDGQVLPGLVKVLRILCGSNISTWSLASWLRSPEVELGGLTPLAALLAGGEDDLVLLVASHAAAGWKMKAGDDDLDWLEVPIPVPDPRLSSAASRVKTK
jgi:hypothetical protein